jgi:hypothetical protein
VDLSNQWEAPWLARVAFRPPGQAPDFHQAAELFPASPWLKWFGNTDLEQATRLAPNQPQVYAPLLVAALQHNDCAKASGLWARMTSLELAPELDTNQWCGTDTHLPKSMADRYTPLAMLIELARDSAAAPVAESDFAKGSL